MTDSASGTSAVFTIDQLDYSLPEELIAQQPPPRREDARLLVANRAAKRLRESRISEFPSFLAPGDLLVLNDTKVIPAKFMARRKTGGKVMGLFLGELSPGTWEVLLEGSRRLKVGELLDLVSAREDGSPGGRRVEVEFLKRLEEGRCQVQVHDSKKAAEVLEEFGETPLPPYIERGAGPRQDQQDRKRYQTVYARQPGAVAAPTAGLHLTEALLETIEDKGVEIAAVTLHVGLGTFKPVAVERLAEHLMHEERYEVSPATLQALRGCRARGGRVVAVGTTTVRVLETVAPAVLRQSVQDPASYRGKSVNSIENRQSTDENSTPLCGSTSIFIYPPYPFRLVDALLTNFHLPRSTLLALVMAFAGVDLTRHAYRHAMAERYRFYSYGDAMLIL